MSRPPRRTRPREPPRARRPRRRRRPRDQVDAADAVALTLRALRLPNVGPAEAPTQTSFERRDVVSHHLDHIIISVGQHLVRYNFFDSTVW